MKALAAALLLLAPAARAEGYLETVESDAYTADGTARQIWDRAKACAGQELGPEAVRGADADAGTIAADCRADYLSLLMGYSVKSTLVLTAEEGKFRMRHTGITYHQKDPSVKDPAWIRVPQRFGSGWKDAQRALLKKSDALARCIRQASMPPSVPAPTTPAAQPATAAAVPPPAAPTEAPALSAELALALARDHARERKLDADGAYVGAVSWRASGGASAWRVEWRKPGGAPAFALDVRGDRTVVPAP